MQAFNALSVGDKWRVTMSIARGTAPTGPALAPAAIELAEGFQRQGRAITWLAIGGPLLVGTLAALRLILGAHEGDQGLLFVNVFLVVGSVASLMLSPVARPRKVARSLELSRQVVDSA